MPFAVSRVESKGRKLHFATASAPQPFLCGEIGAAESFVAVNRPFFAIHRG